MGQTHRLPLGPFPFPGFSFLLLAAPRVSPAALHLPLDPLPSRPLSFSLLLVLFIFLRSSFPTESYSSLLHSRPCLIPFSHSHFFHFF